MDIFFQDKKFAKSCNNQKLLIKEHGLDRASRIRRRLDDLSGAVSLVTMRDLPGRCHELRGDRAGQLSLDLDGPYRLIFEPANDPIPKKLDGGIDWTQVTAVRIIGVDNTHE
ncbi:killer suppression protein HigA [Tumidithrix elongata RA019]|uniref:Killer suppression protein HigA n=1 Tax=Tumidithrix elongata BACA0141 TaxID=2716417 RepID=A0AAW9PRR3_9CYAN|nr:killer suppression protein HigA [Tumidithrix elongata RA019]